MMFASIEFLYYFLPALLIIYFITPNKIPLRNMVLLIASMVFYAWGGPKFLFLILGQVFLAWLFGLFIHKWHGTLKARVTLILSIVVGLAGLMFFKYTNFFIENFNAITGLGISELTWLIVPLGISFYTFQLLSYNIDLYRGTVQVQKNPLTLATYVMLFPQVMAGPIVRYADIIPALTQRKSTFNDFYEGIRRFTVGLGKSILIGGAMANLTTALGAEASVLAIVLRSASFTFQIYFQFSGYSDMAIALGRIFGFRITENFNYPLTAQSITDFWRRWHISLGLWLRDYIYIPMGGNRKRQWLNILVVWSLIGFLQGAAWNFILWGLFFVVVLLVEKKLLGNFLANRSAIFRHIYTLIIVLISFMIFRANNVFEAQSLAGPLSLFYLRSYAVLLALAAIGSTELPRRLFMTRYVRWLEPVAVALCLIVSTAFLVDTTFDPLLYVRF
ncbi:MAG: MBOAT family protein [Oscillospiraceae bacterium]|nr:MBOAT family protein [Oscillospiraceae bacterium]